MPFPLALNFSFSLALNGCQKDRAQPTPRPAPLKASALFLLNKINDAWHHVCLKSPHLKNAHLPPYFSSALAPLMPIFRISTANFRGRTSNFLSPEFWCVSKQNSWTGAGGHHSFKKNILTNKSIILKRALETVPQSNIITITITMNDHQHPPHFLHQDVIPPPPGPPPSLDLRSGTPPSGVSSLIYRICHHHHHHYHHQQHHHPRDHSNQCNNYKSVAISSNFTSYILMAPIGDLTSCQWKDINLKDSVNIAHWIFPDILQWIFPDILQ